MQMCTHLYMVQERDFEVISELGLINWFEKAPVKRNLTCLPSQLGFVDLFWQMIACDWKPDVPEEDLHLV